MTRTEQNAARTILGQSVGQVNVDGRTYDIPAPTTATLIMVSALATELPEFATSIPKEDIVPTVLRTARHCNALGQIAAVLVLGAKRIRETPFATVEKYHNVRRWSWLRLRKTERVATTRQTVVERDYLAGKILAEMTSEALHELVVRILGEAGIADFFVLTTSLRTKRLLAPTREVETTASGHLSEVGLSTCN